MIGALFVHLLQYAGYAVEVVMVTVLLTRGRWKENRAFAAYFFSYVAIDVVLRPSVLYTYGLHSVQYSYVYWMSDVSLSFATFLLICFFFRRACSGKPEVWSYLRSMLAAVFVLITFISYFSIAHHYDHLFSRFIVDLQQNLYFACLVLNTLLYIMLQQWESADEQLSLLVSGLGIGLAGPAADMALMYLTPGGSAAGVMLTFLLPLCSLGTYMVWLYAMAQKVDQAPPLGGVRDPAKAIHNDGPALGKFAARNR